MKETAKEFLLQVTASVYLVFRRVVFLALKPYKTMRTISTETDTLQVGIIFLLVFTYFLSADYYRPFAYPPIILFVLVLIHVFGTVMFFYGVSLPLGSKQKDIRPHIMTFSYALIPTLIWFTTTFFLYIILPPPRNETLNGTLFTLVYITFAVSMLLWKLILTYLAIRFSTRMRLSRIIYSFLLYLLIVGPYSVFLYLFQFFRVPFI